MSFWITGDTHGTIDIGKVTEFFSDRPERFGRDDCLIICGDVGVCGFSAASEDETRRILSSLPVTVLFVDGNHEHFGTLNKYRVTEWNGGKVHIIRDNIIHLMRGQYYVIDGRSFFTFGGAYSIDRMYRRAGATWFPEELPTKEEYEEGWSNLEAHGFKVNYIITHTAPENVTREMRIYKLSDDEQPLRRYFQRIADNTSFGMWYFGHFHADIDTEKYRCLYRRVVVL